MVSAGKKFVIVDTINGQRVSGVINERTDADKQAETMNTKLNEDKKIDAAQVAPHYAVREHLIEA